MRKSLIITSIIAILIVVAFLYFNNSNSDELEIPEKTKYTLIYSTGENQPEKAQISYLDADGEKIDEI